ncbi:MAG: toll/interleukin-1 receptor domain-containing protein [Candidatus Lokiarchaeota archaeon]
MKIFISHAYDEKEIAHAWKTLFEQLEPSLNVWYSSDITPGEGIGIGRWREKISKELKEADIILSILTPESSNRPWIVFESAYAMGLSDKNLVIPIIYYMTPQSLPSPLQELQSYNGDDREKVIELCERLINRTRTNPVDDGEVQYWKDYIDFYMKEIESHSEERVKKALFYGDFHTYDTAKKLEGEWWAKWTQMNDDGTETIWQIQPITIETTNWRIRMIGDAAQGVLSPFEGVVSSKGHIALSYWVQGDSAICGTILLEVIGSIMEGVWRGYTAMTTKERLSLVEGRVFMSRDKTETEEFKFKPLS